MGSCSFPASKLPNHWWVCSSQKYVENLQTNTLQHCFLGSGAQAMRNSRHVSFLVPFVSINEQLRRGPEGVFWRNRWCQRYRRDKREKRAKEKPTPQLDHNAWRDHLEGSQNLFSCEFLQSEVAACLQNRARLTMDFHLAYRVVDTWTATSPAMIILTSDGGIAGFSARRLSHNRLS